MFYVLAQYWLPALATFLVGAVVGWWYWLPADVRDCRRIPPSG